MSLLTTLALVAIPLVKRKDRVAALEERLAAVEAERDLWRNECLVVRQRLTEAALENVNLGGRLKWADEMVRRMGSPPEHECHRQMWGYSRQRPELVEWADCTCTPDRAEALKRGE